MCNHPDPNLCERLGRHIYGGLWTLWHHNAEYRAKWLADAPFRTGQAELGRVRPGHRSLPCEMEGRVIRKCTRGEAEQRHLRECSKHGQCTRGYVAGNVTACSLCPDYSPGKQRVQWISVKKMAIDSIILASKVPPDVRAIAGVPRSGMPAAAIIATILHLPLFEASEATGLRQLGNGGRGFKLLQNGPIFVVDDTVYHGFAMERVRAKLKEVNAVYSALYVRTGMTSTVQSYVEEVPDLHMLEWNAFNNGPLAGLAANPAYQAGVATDLDGVLLHDHESGGRPGDPFLVARKHMIPLIATGRSVKHREQTEAELRRHGILWRKLEMLPAGIEEVPEEQAEHKAAKYIESKCGVFIESDDWQAQEIFRLSKRPVVSLQADKVYQ
jgi:hypothetical protein